MQAAVDCGFSGAGRAGNRSLRSSLQFQSEAVLHHAQTSVCKTQSGLVAVYFSVPYFPARAVRTRAMSSITALGALSKIVARAV